MFLPLLNVNNDYSQCLKGIGKTNTESKNSWECYRDLPFVYEALTFRKVRNQLTCTSEKSNIDILFKWRWLIKIVLNWEPIQENIHIRQTPKEWYKESTILWVERIRRLMSAI